MNNGRFSNGFILGLIIGGGAVFLLGTKTGKNILKIISEEGFDGLLGLLEEYELADVEDEQDEEVYEEAKTETENHSNGVSQIQSTDKETEGAPKKRFFKRIRR